MQTVDLHMRSHLLGLYIRDKGVRELAAQVAAADHVSITEAVRRALHARVARQSEERDERWRRLREIQERIAGLPDLSPGFTDKDLYDERGNAIL
jgi:hypothetical protein